MTIRYCGPHVMAILTEDKARAAAIAANIEAGGAFLRASHFKECNSWHVILNRKSSGSRQRRAQERQEERERRAAGGAF